MGLIFACTTLNLMKKCNLALSYAIFASKNCVELERQLVNGAEKQAFV